jgi:hypothetical protein
MQHLAKNKKDRAINNEILLLFSSLFYLHLQRNVLYSSLNSTTENPNFSSIKCRVRMVEIHVLMDHHSDSEFKRRVECEL